ncbi:5'-nucleotidase C-terminal domain-containing protein [Lunatibacter salilacus]|uniref:5'-nucleotidase C-terminal domain-containing protein n=1 Tax=Lunatibacter salilacus TaxID=2483804 RepID=UPI00131C29E7|nr:5'-nucleotidase [Lunatibacter salilacus]
MAPRCNKPRPLSHYYLLFMLPLILGCGRYQSTGYTAAIHPVSENAASDEELVAFIRPFKENLEKEMNTVIGQSRKELNTKGTGETTLGNLVADLQKEFAKEKFDTQVDISVMNNGGLRNTLPEGDITLGNIYELSPFENYLYLLELDGEGIAELATYAVAKKNLGLSGLTLIAEDNKLVAFEVNGEAVDPAKKYTVAINDYLANGGDYMDFLPGKTRLIASEYLIRDLMIYKIKERSKDGLVLDAEIEGRQKYN